MESSLRELAMYRMERAFEMLIAAEDNLKIGQYKTSLNRSYYAIFHAMRAANIIKGFDSSKHSGVIAFFKCSRGLFKNGKSQPSGESSNLPALNGDSELSQIQNPVKKIVPICGLGAKATNRDYLFYRVRQFRLNLLFY